MFQQEGEQGGESSWVSGNLANSVKEEEGSVANMICVGEQETELGSFAEGKRSLDIGDFIPFTTAVAIVVQVT